MTIPERREAVWLAMANQFLDSEERAELPEVAMTALRAGLTVEEARRVWMYEVAPALAFNLWAIFGVWGAWDPAFVLERVRRVRCDPSRPRALAEIRYFAWMFPFHFLLRALLRTMDVLSEAEGPARDERALDLAWVAAHFFDFLPSPAPPSDRARLARTYETLFFRALGPAVLPSERDPGAARVRSALAIAP